jgi:hypothetical protein
MGWLFDQVAWTTDLCGLGLPISVGRLRCVDFQYILDKSTTKMVFWQGKLVAIDGKNTLIKSTLSSSPSSSLIPHGAESWEKL